MLPLAVRLEACLGTSSSLKHAGALHFKVQVEVQVDSESAGVSESTLQLDSEVASSFPHCTGRLPVSVTVTVLRVAGARVFHLLTVTATGSGRLRVNLNKSRHITALAS